MSKQQDPQLYPNDAKKEKSEGEGEKGKRGGPSCAKSGPGRKWLELSGGVRKEERSVGGVNLLEPNV